VKNSELWFADDPVVRIPGGGFGTGLQTSVITFPGPGCWEITGASGEVSITFTVRMEIVPAEE
jgi:hypothetical protein